VQSGGGEGGVDETGDYRCDTQARKAPLFTSTQVEYVGYGLQNFVSG